MKLAEDLNNQKFRIRAYTEAHIQINDDKLTHSFILSRDHLDPHWQLQDLRQLTADSLEPILALNPELIILGSGSEHIFPPSSLIIDIAKLGIGLEVMTTMAACRTYNLLANDDRKVVAGFII